MKRKIFLLNIAITVLSSAFFMISTSVTQRLIDEPRIALVLELSIIWVVSMIMGVLKSYTTQKYFLIENKHHMGKVLNKIIHLPYSFLETEEYADDYNEVKINLEREWLTAVCVILTASCDFIGLYFLVKNQLSLIYIIILYVIAIVFIIVSWIASTRLSTLMYDYWQKYIKNTRKYAYFNGVLTEKNTYKDKKIFAFSPFFTKLFEQEFDKAAEKNRKLGKKRIKLEFFIDLMFLGYVGVSFVVLLYSYNSNVITVGLFISSIGYIISLSDKIIEAIKSTEIFVRYKLHNKRIDEFMKKSEVQEFERDTNKFKKEKTVLAVENLFFKYPNNTEPILKNINLNFEKGKKYAIVGENGSGKTTLVKLLIGLYSPVLGDVFFEERPIALFQDFNKYPMTLLENIALKDANDYDKQSVISAVRAIGLENKVSKMKRGIDTELTVMREDGEDLSGGEWQRVGLARILCAESEICILDEPTANLDPLEEIKIFDTYNELLNDKTVIYITHRLGFVKAVDEIIVMNNGVVAEKGTHQELVALKNGIYKRMYEEQRSWYEK